MQILVTCKQLGAKRAKLTALPFPLHETPTTVRDLIRITVASCVNAFQRGHSDSPTPLTQTQIEAQSTLGKIAFGLHYNSTEIQLEAAVQTALEAYQDGLVRIFINGTQLGGLDSSLQLHENDTVTFLRLTMLTGRLW